MRSSVPAGLASDHARVKVQSDLFPGRRLLNHTGYTVPTISQDGPSSERGRGKHPDELLRSSGAALVARVTPVPVQASDHARIKVLSLLVPGRRLLYHAGSTAPAIAQDGPSSERGRSEHPNDTLQSIGAACVSSVPVRKKHWEIAY